MTEEDFSALAAQAPAVRERLGRFREALARHFVGKGEILKDPALAEKMAPVYDQKYWISWIGFFRPRADRVRDGKTVIVKVTPAS